MNGSGGLAVFTFHMLQTGYSDVHINNMILIYSNLTLIPCSTVDYFTAVRGGKQYIVRLEGNPLEVSGIGGFGAMGVTSSSKLANYEGNMTFEMNGTSDLLPSDFAYFNATIPNQLMNCTSAANWIVELNGLEQSGVIVNTGTTNTTISLSTNSDPSFTYYPSVSNSSGKRTLKIEILSNYVAAPALTVTILPTVATLDIGQSQIFTLTASYGTPPCTYQWYLDGVAVSGANGSTWTFMPESSGYYDVYAKVTDAAGAVAKSNTAFVIVNPAFSVSILPTNATLDFGQSVTFTSAVSGGTSPYEYQWCLNGVAVSGATSPAWTFTPSSFGIYYVYLNVTDMAGAGAKSDTAYIIASSALSVSISPSSVTLDVGQPWPFAVAVSGGTPPFVGQWYLNGSRVPTGPIIPYTMLRPGFYTVYLRVTDAVGATVTSNTANLTLNPAVSVSILPTAVAIGVGQSHTFNATVSGGTSPYSFQWYLDGSAVAGATSSTWTYTPPAVGSHIVYATVTDSVGSQAQSSTAQVLVGYVLTLSANVTVPNLTFTIDGVAYTGPVSVILSPGSHTITVQTQVLIARNRLYSAYDRFVGWSNTQTDATIQVTLTANTQLTADYTVGFAGKVIPT
jgi:hypothetical protein